MDEFSAMFKALSNPHRLTIFTRLAGCCKGWCVKRTQGEYKATVGELSRDLKIAPSTVSHHIKELKTTGLITIERKGQTVCCCVEPNILKRMREFFEVAEDKAGI
ncbi:MAG: metalloregulator ArsR/SmtB family transcription factor [candidate division Zixibacteria bacterium]